MRRRLFGSIMSAGLLLVIPATAYASSDRFSQKILPLNCIFEEVNDGLGSLYYLTPAECGVVIQPPQSVSQPSQGAQAFVPTPQLQSYNPNQPLAGSLNVRAVLPWEPIVAVVKSDGTVVVGGQPSESPANNTSLIDAVKRLLGDSVHPTPLKVTVGISVSVFIIVLLFLALI